MLPYVLNAPDRLIAFGPLEMWVCNASRACGSHADKRCTVYAQLRGASQSGRDSAHSLESPTAVSDRGVTQYVVL